MNRENRETESPSFEENRSDRLARRVKESGNPVVMGIVNVTPDSFFDGGRHFDPLRAVDAGIRMVEEGAEILDVGGESTRPGAMPVEPEEEMDRILPVIEGLRKQTNCMISVDTYKCRVAEAAVEAGADMVNDISFGSFDREMLDMVAGKGCWYVGMHILGTPRNMQQNPQYENVVDDVRGFLLDRAARAIDSGISRKRIFLDPGIGFGKTDDHNIQLLKAIPRLVNSGFPVLVGASRKSMMGRLLGLDPEDRLSPSLTIAIYAAKSGASVIRVHDVPETVHALRMWRLLCE